VWYAAYDEDLNSNQMLSKLMKINNNKDKDDIDALPMEIQSVVINNYQLCFDQAISDFPLVKDYQPPSPNTSKFKIIRKDYSEPSNHIYARLYLIKKT